MKKRNRFISLALTLGLALSVMATSVSASKFVDAHGNEVELDDTLEAYSSVVLSGADNAARKAETNLGDLWTDALRWFAVSGKINAYFDEDDVAAGKHIAETLFFRKRLFAVRLLYQVVIQGAIHLVGIFGIAYAGDNG